MANPISVPGTVVSSGAAISPGGAQGLQGLQGTTALANSTQSGLLQQTSGNTTDFIDGTNNSQPLQPVIWSATRRVFNATGNPTFEVNMRNPGTTINLPAGTVSPWAQDRWQNQKAAATMALTSQTAMSQGGIYVPGTNFRISQGVQNITLTTAQASLAAGEYGFMQQTVEGPQYRELSGDVHSISVLAYTNVTGGLKFAVAIRDPGNTRSLVKLCALTTANAWQLISLPNLPIFPSAGNFSTDVGTIGYLLTICYACGTTYIAPANDTWQNGNFIGAVGMDNLGAKPTGSALLLSFIQHEPGAQCTTPMDCSFGQNLDGNMGCLRYFTKSYDYGTKPGASGSPPGYKAFHTTNVNSWCMGSINYPKVLAKAPPTVTIYAPDGTTGAALQLGGSNAAIAAIAANGASGFCGLNFASAQTLNTTWQFHYAADTGW